MALPKVRTFRVNTRTRRSTWKAKVPQFTDAQTPEGETVRVPRNLAAAVRRGYWKP